MSHMTRTVSIARLARSAGLDPLDVTLQLMERGVDVDDPATDLDTTEHKAARAVIREMKGGRRVVHARTGPPFPGASSALR